MMGLFVMNMEETPTVASFVRTALDNLYICIQTTVALELEMADLKMSMGKPLLTT